MRKIVFLTAAVMVCYASVFALGALYARRAMSNETGRPLWLKSYDADVEITDQIAVTHVDHVFKNESSNRLEGVFVFPLPKGAVVTELALWINGKRVVGDVMEKDTARAVYENIVRRTADPALLEYMGDNVFKLSVFPIEPDGNAMSERRIEITYAELLSYRDERVAYTFLMKTANLSSKPVERASINGKLTSQKALVSLNSPTHAAGTLLSIQRKDDQNYTFVYGSENAHSQTDLVISYRIDESAFALNHLVYIPDPKKPMFFDTTGDNGYFLLWITPPQNLSNVQVLPKNIALVADVSSSMSGERIVQLRKALNTIVDMLSEKDRFSILSFSTSVKSFSPDMVPATGENIEDAHSFINALSEAGLTNYEDALREALKCTWSEQSANVIVFFTDGEPTWPRETSAARIIDLVEDLNTRGVSIFTFGVGKEPKAALLENLASSNSGEYYPITSDAAIAEILSAFMKRIMYPMVKNIAISYGNIGQYDVFPRTLPDLFAGSQLTVLGRFRSEGVSTVSFSGQQATETIRIEESLHFDETQSDHPFVPRMWASSKIDYLLGEIAVTGEQKELVDNVKFLGRKYGIITPYTSMLVVEPGGMTSTLEDKTAPLPSAPAFSVASDMTSGTVTLRYSIPFAGTPQRVVVRIFDARGRMVRKLVDEVVRGGNFTVGWNCRSDAGAILAAGNYIALLESGSVRMMAKIRLVR